MSYGIIWCPYCGRPHKLGQAYCPSTGKLLEQRVHSRTHASARKLGTRRHPLIGTVIDGKYEILKRLGKGGASEVFEAENKVLGKRVALKIVSNTAGSARERLRREASIVGSIQHPNICDLYDLGTMADGTPYLVLELLTGETLESLIRRGRRMAPHAAVEVFSHILSGLHVAHSAGIIHRDLKPANVFLVERAGCSPVVKILDFGFAKEVSGRFEAMTRPGKTCGTPAYMSPEQLLVTPLDSRSDLFSVGLMLYEAITGQHAFAASSVTEVCINIVRGTPLRLRDVRSRVPVALEAVVHRALEKSPALRFSSALDMQVALLASIEGDDEMPDSSDSLSLPRLIAADSSTSVH